MEERCPFCSPVPGDIALQNSRCYVRYDRYPVSRGHLLILPFRHVANFFEITEDERKAAFELVWRASQRLDSELHPDGYNVGINVGLAAGQTIAHAHIHLIPRYCGDVPDPRGGVRFVVPQKGNYWDQPGPNWRSNRTNEH